MHLLHINYVTWAHIADRASDETGLALDTRCVIVSHLQVESSFTEFKPWISCCIAEVTRCGYKKRSTFKIPEMILGLILLCKQTSATNTA